MESGQTVVIAHTARWKAVLLFAVCFMFTGAVIFGLSTGQQADGAPLHPIAWVMLPVIAGLAAFGSFIAARLVLYPQEIWLSPEGLTTTKWRKIIRWNEVESFYLGAYERPSWPWSDRFVFLRFKYPSEGFLRNRQRFGHDSVMPKLLNVAPAKLVKILEDWRLRYG